MEAGDLNAVVIERLQQKGALGQRRGNEGGLPPAAQRCAKLNHPPAAGSGAPPMLAAAPTAPRAGMRSASAKAARRGSGNAHRRGEAAHSLCSRNRHVYHRAATAAAVGHAPNSYSAKYSVLVGSAPVPPPPPPSKNSEPPCLECLSSAEPTQHHSATTLDSSGSLQPRVGSCGAVLAARKATGPPAAATSR